MSHTLSHTKINRSRVLSLPKTTIKITNFDDYVNINHNLGIKSNWNPSNI